MIHYVSGKSTSEHKVHDHVVNKLQGVYYWSDYLVK